MDRVQPLVMVAALALAACTSSHNGAARDAGRDGLSCEPAGSCAHGAPCGTTCCAAGEACIAGVCMCGDQPACTGGNLCATPIASPDGCGELCCGVTSVCPGVE